MFIVHGLLCKASVFIGNVECVSNDKIFTAIYRLKHCKPYKVTNKDYSAPSTRSLLHKNLYSKLGPIYNNYR